ncbi:MAG: hypothetical protein JWM47_526 [Acidimicrobiales bacterium]|nr:hypothetical protein [Acidimicrobiales bacterium]
MAMQHVVVDGSNIATEGRTTPSLAQLDEAVRAFLDAYGDVALTVVVDATFGHRIDDSERAEFEAGIVNGELVSPPAGAIGRGDAFILQIADKAGASVFSNDSFQEFHGTYEWLFDEGRLVGGKPVPNVGWVFVLRTPVRGPTSRRATRESKGTASKRLGAAPVPSKPPPRARRGQAEVSSVGTEAPPAAAEAVPPVAEAGGRKRSPRKRGAAAAAPETIVDTTVSETSTSSNRNRRRRVSGKSAADPINEPMPFLKFVTDHPVGSEVEATVDRFSSHGAYAVSDGALCYIPLKAMADPPPTKAREVLTVGETRTFVVTAFDPPRRGIDVALPGVVVPDVPTDPSAPDRHDDGFPTGKHQSAEEAPSMAVKKKAAAAKKAVAKKATTAKKAVAKKAAPAKKAVAKKVAPAKKAVAKKAAPAKKAVAKKAPAKKAPAKKAPAKKAPAKKAVAKKAPAKKAPAKKAVAKKAPAKKAPAKKAPAKKAPAKKAVAKKAPAKKA